MAFASHEAVSVSSGAGGRGGLGGGAGPPGSGAGPLRASSAAHRIPSHHPRRARFKLRQEARLLAKPK